MRRTILDGGINWNLYLCADFNEQTKECHVYYYERWHKYESDKHPKCEIVTWFDKKEDSNRVLQSVKFNGIVYKVTNPKYIFDYKDFSVLELE